MEDRCCLQCWAAIALGSTSAAVCRRSCVPPASTVADACKALTLAPDACLPTPLLQALGLATVLGGVLAAVLVTCSDGALAMMGAGPETGNVHELATEFLTIR